MHMVIANGNESESDMRRVGRRRSSRSGGIRPEKASSPVHEREADADADSGLEHGA